VKSRFYVSGLVTVIDSSAILSQLFGSDSTGDLKAATPLSSAPPTSTIANESATVKSSKTTKNVRYKNEALAQILFADRIILNKTDLVSTTTLSKVVAAVKEINEFAQTISTQYSKVPLDFVLGVISVHPNRDHVNKMTFLDHDPSVQSVCLTSENPINLNVVMSFLQREVEQRKEKLLRIKGCLNVEGNDNRVVIQGVGSKIQTRTHTPWGSDPRTNVLVFIGRDLGDLQASTILQGQRH